MQYVKLLSQITQKKYVKTQKEEKEIIEKLKTAEETLKQKSERQQELEKELQVYKFKQKEFIHIETAVTFVLSWNSRILSILLS